MIEVLGLRAIEIQAIPERGIDLRDLDRGPGPLPRIAACVLSPTWNNPTGASCPEGKRRWSKS
jgi:DNA-binding transcriptional MocR family regulator